MSPPPLSARTAAIHLLFALTLALCIAPATQAHPPTTDPLPSWNEGPTKQAILSFMARVTKEGGPGFVPVEDRIAVFDNDGTLWPEKPVIQGAFLLDRLKTLAAKDPSLKQRQPYKAALEGDVAYFMEAGEKAVMELIAATQANQSDEQYEAEVRAFFKSARHPKLDRPYTELAYKPMTELLDYLRANGFQTWISSGGDIDFMRVIAQKMYGIPPDQVIGTHLKKKFLAKNNSQGLWIEPELDALNDKEGKPVGIDLHIGKRPVFAAGNVRSGGDVAMLEYSQGQKGPSFQLIINHDDAQREFAYQEKDNATLTAARANRWNVVSMKRDWKIIFCP